MPVLSSDEPAALRHSRHIHYDRANMRHLLRPSLIVAAGHELREADVVVEEGKTARVELDLTGASDAPTELVVTDPITDAPKPEREPRDVNLGKIAGGSALIGVGVAALGAGTAIRLQGLEFHDHYSALDGDGDGFIDPENEAEAKRLWEQEIRPRKVQSAALFGVGGLAIAGGAGVFIILEDDGAMLGVTGRF